MQAVTAHPLPERTAVKLQEPGIGKQAIAVSEGNVSQGGHPPALAVSRPELDPLVEMPRKFNEAQELIILTVMHAPIELMVISKLPVAVVNQE